MSASLASEVSLPTLEKLNVKQPEDVDAHEVAATWLHAFSNAATLGDFNSVLGLILEDGIWRDMLAFTWDLRTFIGTSRIQTFLNARLAETKVAEISLAEDKAREPVVFNAISGILWVQGMFDFETAAGTGTGLFRIVPTPNGQWKAFVVYTNLDSLRGLPSKIGSFRNNDLPPGGWYQQFGVKKAPFESSDPKVLVIGAGHSGLGVAARLTYSDVPTLVVEKEARVGDSWRNRYDSLCLHDPVWLNQMPYLNYPSTWPMYTPAPKFADWLESYARSLELNVWTSTFVKSIKRDDTKEEWIVTVTKPDGSMRTVRPKHVIFASGFCNDGTPNMPELPGMNEFQGEILHGTAYKAPKGLRGKKVVVVGACTSGHDISHDLYSNGIDVTMVQRSSTCVISAKKGYPALVGGLYREGGPPVEIADRIVGSFPRHMVTRLHQLSMKMIANLDRELIEGLEKVGFKTNLGPEGAGLAGLLANRFGGYYIDVGASQLIIDGKIKLKHGSIKNFGKDELVFEDGSKLKAEVVICATGYGNLNVAAGKVLGVELASKLKPLMMTNDEGEVSGVWGDSGLPNLHFMFGNISRSRFHSTHLALLIKAKEAELYTTSYLD